MSMPAGRGGEPVTLWSALGQPYSGFAGGRYRLTDLLLFIDSSALRLNPGEIPVERIVAVGTTQDALQASRGLGTIVLTVAEPAGNRPVLLEDVPGFELGAAAIASAAEARRDALAAGARGTPVDDAPTDSS